MDTNQGMPCFSSEKEFNSYFKHETEICNKHRNKDGVLEFETKEDIEKFFEELGMEIVHDAGTNIHAIFKF
jgi:hypothetical protein